MFIKILRKIDIIYYCLVLLLFDYLLHIVFYESHFNFIHVLFFDISISIFIYLLLTISKGIVKVIIYTVMNIIFLLYSFLVLIQIFLKINYDTTYPIKTISYNVFNVLSQYNDEIIDIVNNHLLLIIILILFIILLVIISSLLFFNEKNFTNKNIIITLVLLFISIVITFCTIKKNITNWQDNLSINGLKTAIIYDLKQERNKYVDINTKEYSINAQKESSNNIKNPILDSNKYNINKKTIPSDFELDEYNIMNYDFDSLNKNENRSEFIITNNYIKSLSASKKNKFTGLFKGKNLIMICAEAWNSIIVDKELFPTMYRLINNGFKFNNFYQPHSGSSTSSGEYTFMTGMISVEDDYSFRDSIENNMGFTISSKLHDEGYKTYSFHNGISTYYNRNETHEKLLNFDQFYANDTGLFPLLHKQWPDDLELFDSTFDILAKEQPFMAYYMTYTAHMPYKGKADSYYLKYKDKIDAVYGDTKSIVFKNYVAKNMLLEIALTNLINNLEKNDLLNDTVICMVPDHYPYGLYRSNQYTHTEDNYVAELYNDENIDENKIKRDKTEIIFWCGSLENVDKDKAFEIDKPTCTIDITPTLLNLFGIEFDSRLYPGHDMFSNMEGIVIYQDGRFVTENYICHNGSEDVPEEYAIYKNIVNNANSYCKFNIKNDYYGYLVGKTGESKKICYLMFEGGPTDNTLKILDILDKADVKATFFISDNKKLEYLSLISDKEHKVGISLDNIDLLLNNQYEQFEEKINKLFTEILNVTRDKAYFVHFTKEVKDKIEKENNIFLTQQLNTHLIILSLKEAVENIDSKDLTIPITKADIVHNVLTNIEDKDHIFVLFHDNENSDITILALPQIIDGLKFKGYTFKYMDQITKINN